MSGARHKQKGDRIEREIVSTLKAAGIPAKRVPLSGSVQGYPGDIQACLNGCELTLEVKARKDFKTLYKWLDGRDGLILKGDRQEPLIVLRLSDYLQNYRRAGDHAKPEPTQGATRP